MTATDPPWLTVGAKVAVYGCQRVFFYNVAKITKRDVVLDNGERFNRERLQGYNRSNAGWGSFWCLASPTDPKIVRMHRQEQIADVRDTTRYKVSDLMTVWGRSGDNDEPALKALELLQSALVSLERYWAEEKEAAGKENP